MIDKEKLKVGYDVIRHHLSFYKYFWKTQTLDKLCIGLHTRIICEEIDKAIDKFDNGNGESSFLLITVPPRHGKSDMVSRYLPAHFMGMFPDKDVIIATYSASLAFDLSKDARKIVRTPEYKNIFGQELSKESSAVDSWKMKDGKGTVTASGLLSGITGKGAHLLVLDDYLSSRASAESEVIRDKIWESFTNDFMTRRAPVSITIVLATQWHIDDVIGRIKNLNNPNNKSYNPNFPKFKLLSFPAENGVIEVENRVEPIKYDYLFTEKEIDGYHYDGRFKESDYIQSRAILGTYAYQALYMCNPQQKGGNLIDVSKIKFHDNAADFPQTRYFRLWDLAHTAKQTQKDDPDWTSGTLLTYTKIAGVWHLWIKDVARIRAKAPERNNFILAVTQKDGMNVPIVVENSLDSKDAVSDMQTILSGKRIVKPINIKQDKVARVGYIEPIFEAGNVHLLRGDWNRDWLEEVKAFPSGKHDDQVDNLTAGYFECCQGGEIIRGRVSGV